MKPARADFEDLCKIMKTLEAKGLALKTKGPESEADLKFDIREEVRSNAPAVNKGKHRVAHKPNSKPKADAVVNLAELEEENGAGHGNKALSEEELWAKFEESEKQLEREERQKQDQQKQEQREEQEEQDRTSDKADTTGVDTMSSSCEDRKITCRGSVINVDRVSGQAPPSIRETGAEEDGSKGISCCLPTIYFSHTVEPKKVTINTSNKTSSHHITSPADICRLFVDMRKSEAVPGKSIWKFGNRGNSACSHTGDFEEQRIGHSHNKVVTETDSPAPVTWHPPSRLQPFSGAVVEKDPVPSAIPPLAIIPPAKQGEVSLDAVPYEECTKQVSKFKAAWLQRK